MSTKKDEEASDYEGAPVSRSLLQSSPSPTTTSVEGQADAHPTQHGKETMIPPREDEGFPSHHRALEAETEGLYAVAADRQGASVVQGQEADCPDARTPACTNGPQPFHSSFHHHQAQEADRSHPRRDQQPRELEVQSLPFLMA